jgi:hypothetical protein
MCIKARRARNKISALRVHGDWISDVGGVRNLVIRYFKAHFDEDYWCCPNLDGISSPVLDEYHKKELSDKFSIDEFESMLCQVDGDKSSGPDGFNFKLFGFADRGKSEKGLRGSLLMHSHYNLKS